MPAVFSDIVGTCFDYTAPLEAMIEKFGPQLESHNLNPKIFFHAVQLATERDSVYMDLASRPSVSLPERWIENFPKTLFQSGLSPDQVSQIYTKEGVEYMMEAWMKGLTPRQGFREALGILKDGGVDFYAASNATPDRVKGYFKKAGIEIEDDKVVDCHSVGVAKPDAKPYQYIWDNYAKSIGEDKMIFQASHNWDLAGAKRTGFQTAYITAYEGFACPALWGEPDMTEKDLVALAKKIVEKYGTK